VTSRRMQVQSVQSSWPHRLLGLHLCDVTVNGDDWSGCMLLVLQLLMLLFSTLHADLMTINVTKTSAVPIILWHVTRVLGVTVKLNDISWNLLLLHLTILKPQINDKQKCTSYGDVLNTPTASIGNYCVHALISSLRKCVCAVCSFCCMQAL